MHMVHQTEPVAGVISLQRGASCVFSDVDGSCLGRELARPKSQRASGDENVDRSVDDFRRLAVTWTA